MVVISPFANRSSGFAEVILPVAAAGLETPEVAYRLDGLPFYLSAVLPSAHWSDLQVLEQLAARL